MDFAKVCDDLFRCQGLNSTPRTAFPSLMIVWYLQELAMLRTNNDYFGSTIHIINLGIVVAIAVDFAKVCDDLFCCLFLWHLTPTF